MTNYIGESNFNTDNLLNAPFEIIGILTAPWMLAFFTVVIVVVGFLYVVEWLNGFGRRRLA